jgi:hypothetical protein
VGEVSVAAAGFLALMGVLSDFEFCLGGCPPGENELGASAIFLLVTGAVFLVAGLYWTAYVSRGTVRDALVHGSLANAAFAAAVLLVWVPLGAAGFAPGLTLAVGAAATFAIHEPTPLSRYLRIPAIAVLTLVGFVDDNLALVTCSLLAFPAIGIADTVALRLEADRER